MLTPHLDSRTALAVDQNSASRWDPTALTLLRAHGGHRLVKSFYVANGPNGAVASRAYDRATWFTAEAVPLSDIHEIFRLLQQLESQTDTCVIRGQAAPGTNLKGIRRKKVENGGVFEEVPRRWLMLDVDGIPLPPGTSVLADPVDAARALLDLLAAHAPDLADVTAIVQFSSSAGFDELGAAAIAAGLPNIWQGVAKSGVAAHVYYCLNTPAGEAELKRWLAPLQSAGLRLDAATIHTVQPHYTAAPIFRDGLRDPLAGRRTVLIEGLEDEARLQIPAIAPRLAHGPQGSAGEQIGSRGYSNFLDAIGGPAGFRGLILQAIAAYVAGNWPEVDTDNLKADLRARIAVADPGGRPATTLRHYASDQHLDQLISWILDRESAKQAAAREERTKPVVPTFPDIGVSLAEAERAATAIVGRFIAALRSGETPEMLLRITVGGGKSEAAIVSAPQILSAAHDGGRDGALYYLVPRHDLGGEVLARIAAAHPGEDVAVWRGMDQPDPDAPRHAMCRDPELPRLAAMAGLTATIACPVCPLRDACRYQLQRQQDVGIWVMPNNLAFHDLPKGLPAAAATIFDESFVSAGIAGIDEAKPIQLAVSALTEECTGSLVGLARQRLLELRRMVAAALGAMDQGGITRDAFEAIGFDAASAAEWQQLEWQTKPLVNLPGDLARDGIVDRLREAASCGFTRLRPLLAKYVRALLEGTDRRSIAATLVPGMDLGRGQGCGNVVRFEWRVDFADWAKEASKLILDATTHFELIRQWVPSLTVEAIEVSAPEQRIRQVVDREFGRLFFLQNPKNVRRLADLVTVELAATDGVVLAVLQQAVEEALTVELSQRVADGRLPDDGSGQPARLRLAHYGAITGLDCFRQVAHILVVGRPAINRLEGERLAEIIQGQAVEVVADGDASRWPMVAAGVRLADGSGAAVQQPRHPDRVVEAFRWSVSEGAVLQAIGRGRGVRRAVTVTVLAAMALPLTVAEVVPWVDMQPDRLAVAMAEAAMAGAALPLAPVDLAAARADLWPSVAAAEKDLKRQKGGQTLMKDSYKGLSPLSRSILARYRKVGGRGTLAHALVPAEGGRSALEARVGLLAEFVPLYPSNLKPATRDAQGSAAGVAERDTATSAHGAAAETQEGSSEARTSVSAAALPEISNLTLLHPTPTGIQLPSSNGRTQPTAVSLSIFRQRPHQAPNVPASSPPLASSLGGAGWPGAG